MEEPTTPGSWAMPLVGANDYKKEERFLQV